MSLLSPERKLQRAKITLLRNPTFAMMSGVLMVGKTSICDKTPTARTNGRDETYGVKFVESLKDKELAFVVLHEAMHKMYRHLTTWRKLHDENHQLANAACDYVINLQLRELDPGEVYISMPRDKDGKVMGLIDQRFKGMNAKQVFDILKKECKRGGGSGGEQGDEKQPGRPGNPEQGSGDQDNGGFDEHDWDGAKQLSEEEKRELEREIDQAIRQGAIAAKRVGQGGGDIERELEELLKPKIDWREVLREFVKTICSGKDASSWRRVNRRFVGMDIYLPTLISERVGRILVAIDTSGSIGGKELQVFLSEVHSVFTQVRPTHVDLLYWDGHVAGHEEYSESDMDNLMQTTKPVGGGGTSPSCITRYMDEHKLDVECAIVLTDGYVGHDWGEAQGDKWPCPVLWCIVGNAGASPSVGKAVHIDDWE